MTVLDENKFACSNSRNVNIYDRKNVNFPEKYLTGHYYHIHRVYKLNDNELFTVSGDDGVAKWNWKEGKKLIHHEDLHTSDVMSAVLLDVKNVIYYITCGQDGRIKLLNKELNEENDNRVNGNLIERAETSYMDMMANDGLLYAVTAKGEVEIYSFN